MSTAFRAILRGNQEVPPNASTASGLGTVIFDSTAVTASYRFLIEGVDFGPATGGPAQTATTLDDVRSAHFHNQARGVNGPVVFGQINPAQDADDLAIALNADGSWTVSGIWETTDPANVSISSFAARSVRPRSDPTFRSISTCTRTGFSGARSAASWSPSPTTMRTT